MSTVNAVLNFPPVSWWRRRRARKRAREVLKHVRRLLASNRDIMESEKIAAAEKAIAEFAGDVRGSVEGIAAAMEKLDRSCGRIFPSPKNSGLRESIEIALVAAVVAWGGIRTFFLQPFKIPTGSMQPTLYGVHLKPLPADAKVPMLPQRIVEKILFGRGYIEVKCLEDGELTDIRSGSALKLGPFDFPQTVLTIGERDYTVPVEPVQLERQLGFHLYPRMRFRAGQPIVRCMVNNGDHIFVDKVSYNFRRPHRGEVFVFETKGIEGTRGDFYIKRLAGVGGDELRVKSPELFVNGQRASEKGFVRVMASKDGYEGYSNPGGGQGFQYLTAPGETFAVPKDNYFAMGDNSYHSSDSRAWGPVPHRNLVGRAFFVYWPFSKRSGLVD